MEHWEVKSDLAQSEMYEPHKGNVSIFQLANSQNEALLSSCDPIYLAAVGALLALVLRYSHRLAISLSASKGDVYPPMPKVVWG